jgi:hypothetical protein
MHITEKVITALESAPSIYATEDLPVEEKPFCLRLTLSNGWSYDVYEAEAIDDPALVEFRCFGLVRGFETELGYFMLSEIVEHIVDAHVESGSTMLAGGEDFWEWL